MVLKYKKEFCQQLITHLSKGKSFESFGGTAGVTRKCLYEWVDKYPEFAHAKEVGELKSLNHWEEAFEDARLGRVVTGEGKPVSFPQAAFIFMMKCRFGKFGYKDQPQDLVIKTDLTDPDAAKKQLEDLKTMLRDTACQPSKD